MTIKFLHKISKQYASKWLVLMVDIFVVILTFMTAYFIRFNFRINFDILLMLKQIPFVALVSCISFLLVGSHKSVVRFTGYKDIINLIIGCNILATILIVTTYFSRKFYLEDTFNLSGSIIYIHLLLNVLSLIGLKLFVKAIYHNLSQGSATQKNILIYGAGSSGMVTYDAINTDSKSNYNIIGFIDDDYRKIRKKINLLNVFSLDDITKDFIEKHNVEEIIISIQKIDSHRLLQITAYLFGLGNIKVKIVPPVQQWIDGDLNLGQIQDVKIEDLLGREQISIKNPVLDDEYNNEIILITGAAGSIGSEIARKLHHYNYKKLILVDFAESALYDLQQDFYQNNITSFEAIVSDVRDFNQMEILFSKYKPKIVFHAAAYKHVPLMENNPYEAVKTNICGTKNVSQLAIKYNVKKFILISTDKAVNPTNVMGATKRIAELYVNCLQKKENTKFITTRFGNVLGSNGSVIPLFKKQIDAGGPLTVTHKEITRYFMTISEACQLVLEAATMGNGGEIFVFDMGKSVKIFDLAKNMISLSGFKYPDDIDIKVTGLRPGEKIYEELLADGENTLPTYHEKIMIAKNKPLKNIDVIHEIEMLCSINNSAQPIEIVSIIKKIIPEYKSNNSIFEVLDN